MGSRDETFYRQLAERAGLDYVRLEAGAVDAEAAQLFPAELARRFDAIAVRVEHDALTVAAATVEAEQLAAVVHGVTGRKAHIVVTTPERIIAAQEQVFGSPPVLRTDRFLPAAQAPPAETAFLRRLAASRGLEFTELSALEEECDVEAARLIPERLSRRLRVLGLGVDGDELRLATAYPLDERALTVVESVTGYTPHQIIAPSSRIHAGLDRAFAGAGRRQPLGPPPTNGGRAYEAGRRLGELLIAGRAPSPASLRHALAVQRRTGDRIGRVLVSLGYISQERLAATLAEQLRVPHAHAYEVRPKGAVASALPESVCRAHLFVPLDIVDGVLVVAMADPVSSDAATALRTSTALPTRVLVATESSVRAALEQLFADRYVDLATVELVRRRPEESAHRVLTPAQKLFFLVLLAAVGIGLAIAAVPTLIALTLLSILFYFAGAAYKLALVSHGVRKPAEVPVSANELALLEDRSLPTYTILVPLYHEAELAAQIVEAIDALDYPKTKLDVKLLVEEDDAATIAAVRRARLGSHCHVVVVPDSQPRTKPKACNYGLLHARGEYVVIFDAEDAPEPDQLRKAVIAFRKAPPEVVCVQAKLNYWNRNQNLLTRWFTAEYSQWFDLFLPGLSATRAPIPLGGTSCHFVTEKLLELGAWDPFNVTEDADVGIRLARAGYTTVMIDSTTYEEANSRVYNWIRQRSRWIKGYVQTWLVHMRHPLQLWDELGPAGFSSFQLVVGGTALTVLLNPIYWGLTSAWALTEAGVIRHLFPGPIYFAAAFNLLFGNFAFTYLNAAGAYRRGYYDLVKYSLFSPLYWALMSVAAWKGLLQLVTRPSYWEKTVHGLAEASR